MKKLLAVILILASLLLALTACDSSKKDDKDEEYTISTFKKNLEKSGYNVTELSEDEIISSFTAINLIADNYKIKKGITATEPNLLYFINVFECSSASNAKKLKNDLDLYYSEHDINYIQTKLEGNFILLGHPTAIDNALNPKKTSKPSGDIDTPASLSEYERLFDGTAYTIEHFSDYESDELFSELHLNKKNYGYVDMFSANDYSASTGGAVSVIQCASIADAERLADDLLTAYEELFGGDSSDMIQAISVGTQGAIVIVGTGSAFNIAAGIVDDTEELAAHGYLNFYERLTENEYGFHFLKDVESFDILFESVNLDYSDYEPISFMFAESNASYDYVNIIKCPLYNLEALKNDLISTLSKDDSQPISVEIEGDFVIFGTQAAVSIVLNREVSPINPEINVSLSFFRENFIKASYEIKDYSDFELNKFFSRLGLLESNYKIEGIFSAEAFVYSPHGALVIECTDASYAEMLASDLLISFSERYGIYYLPAAEFKRDGCFVLFGDEAALSAAYNESYSTIKEIYTLEAIEESLAQNGYEITMTTDPVDIVDFFAGTGVYPKEFEVSEILTANNYQNGTYIHVFVCSTVENAYKLYKEFYSIYDEMDILDELALYSYDKFMLYSNSEGTIDIALNYR